MTGLAVGILAEPGRADFFTYSRSPEERLLAALASESESITSESGAQIRGARNQLARSTDMNGGLQ